MGTALGNPFARNRAKALPRRDFAPPPAVDFDDEPDAIDDDDDDDGDGDAALLARAVPASWDFFDVDPDKLRAKQANDEPIELQRVRLQRITRGGERRGIKGEWDAARVSRAWLLQEHGPGEYFVMGINSRGKYVVGGRVHVEAGNPFAASSAAPASPAAWNPFTPPPTAAPADPLVALSHQIIQASVQRLMSDQRPPAPPQDPLRDAIGSMAKMMTLQMSLAQQQQPKQQTDPLALMLIKEMISDRKAAAAAPASSPMEEAFKFVQLGMQLKGMIGGEGPQQDDDGPWIDVLKTAIDRMGPGTVSLLSHAFLPAEAATSVDDMIKAAAAAPLPPDETAAE